jgi:hypothetical protein
VNWARKQASRTIAARIAVVFVRKSPVLLTPSVWTVPRLEMPPVRPLPLLGLCRSMTPTIMIAASKPTMTRKIYISGPPD